MLRLSGSNCICQWQCADALHQGHAAEVTVVQKFNQGCSRRPRRIRPSVPFLVPFCLPAGKGRGKQKGTNQIVR
jgi:hypothetical protein